MCVYIYCAITHIQTDRSASRKVTSPLRSSSGYPCPAPLQMLSGTLSTDVQQASDCL